MSKGTIFAGTKVKTLKSILSLNGGSDIIDSTTDPTVTAVSASAGSLLLNSTTKILYIKKDSGSSTNWVKISTSDENQANSLINGDFTFWQRSTSNSSTADGYLGPDRWYINRATGTTVVERLSAPNSAPFKYYARITASGGAGAANLRQALETTDANLFRGKTVVVSFYARKKTGLTNSIIVSLEKNSTGDTATGGSWSIISSTTIAAASLSDTTFTRFQFTTTVPSDGTAQGLSVNVEHSSTLANTDYFEISGIMLCEGIVAGPFKLAGGTYAGELAMCQRFYEKSYNIDTDPGTVTTNGAIDLRANGTNHLQWIQFKNQKRVSPTMVFYSPNDGATGNWYSNSGSANIAAAINDAGESGVNCSITSTDQHSIAGHWTATAELT